MYDDDTKLDEGGEMRILIGTLMALLIGMGYTSFGYFLAQGNYLYATLGLIIGLIGLTTKQINDMDYGAEK